MKAAPYLYAVSLPERAARSLTALGVGVIREFSELALPPAMRESALYRATAGIGFRFLIEQVGGVYRIYPRKDALSRRFALRYAVGSSVELASIATFHLSPVWVLAALGDVTRTGRNLFPRIGDALKARGLLDRNVRFETMGQLLDGLESASTHLALTVNMPPLDVPGLRREWRQFRANLATLPSAQLPDPAAVERAWNNLLASSRNLRRSVFSVSAAMGMSALSSVPSRLRWLSRSASVSARTTGLVVGQAFLDHYAAASKELSAQGFAAYWSRHYRPYAVAAVRHFLPEKQTWTERLLTLGR